MRRWRPRWVARAAAPGEPGLAGVLSVRPGVGPAFGAVVGTGGGVGALLTWAGPAPWLAAPAAVETSLRRWTALLAGPAIGLVLRWRPAEPGAAERRWRRWLAASPVAAAAGPAVLAAVTAVGSRLDDGGTAWLGLVVGGDDPSALGARVAALRRRCPGEARPLGVAETIAWVRAWCGEAGASEAAAGEVLALGRSLTGQLPVCAADGLRTDAGRTTRYWQVTALPAAIEVGWARHLVRAAGLAGLGFDLCLGCAPVAHPAEERRTIERALASAERRLAGAARAGWSAASVAVVGAARERAELRRRLAALDEPGAHLRRVTLHLAVQGPATEAAGTPLVETMRRLGFELTPIRGRRGVARAWRACGPLPPPTSAAAGLVLPAAEVAALAAWGLGAVPEGDEPGGARTPEGIPSLGLTPRPGGRALVATGQAPAETRATVQAAALQAALRGVPVLALDGAADWSALAAATGGQACWLGPGGDAGLEPLAAEGYALGLAHGWRAWLAETGRWLEHLLPSPSEADREATRAVLIELGLAERERQAPPTLDGLRRRLREGGHAATADALDAALRQRAWLDRPAVSLARRAGLSAVGWSGPVGDDWALALATLTRRLWRTWPARAGGLVVIEAGATVLANALASDGLLELVRRAPALGVECWLLAGPVALLARTGAGRALLAAAPDRATFHDPAASAHDLEAALGWPPPLAALVRRLPPGMALLRLNDRIEVSRSTLAPLMGHLLTGPTAQVWPRPTTVSA